MQSKRPCSHTGFWIGISLLIAFLLMSFLFNISLLISLGAAGRPRVGNADGGEDEFPRLAETWSYGSGDVKAARIPVTGVIFRETQDRLFGVTYDPVEQVLRQVRAAENDKDIRAIVLEVDSPGGELTATDEIYKALVDFKASRTDRVIVVFVHDMAASGGYYISAPADWIIAQPTAIIGSIGVIMQTLNWKGLSEKIGVTDTTIASGTNKALLNPFRDVPPEQLALMQEIVDAEYRRFFTIVQTSRNIEEARLKEIADGRILSAESALNHKLVDQIGYWKDAMAKTAELLGVPNVRFIRYKHKQTFFEMLSEVRTPFRLADRAIHGTPKLMYLWKP